MSIRIGINGVGRIGRNLWRIIHTSAPDLTVAAVNDTAGAATVAQLLARDTVRGGFPAAVDRADGAIVVGGGPPVPVLAEPVPVRIDWAAHGVDLVIEATGQFVRGQGARGHLRTAPTVVISTATPAADACLMMGINEHTFDPVRHRLLANSCCSTYCLAAMLSPLHQAYEVIGGSAVIAYSHGSRPGPLLDGPYAGNRLARGNASNLIPANVPGVRHALDRVLPELAGRIMATAMRVPSRATSAASLVVRLGRPVEPAELNAALATAASTLLKGYLEVSAEPLVSSDLLGSPASCVVDTLLTRSVGDLAQVLGWYDNEWGYAHRLVDLARFVANGRR